jgi:hypothetical protein
MTAISQASREVRWRLRQPVRWWSIAACAIGIGLVSLAVTCGWVVFLQFALPKAMWGRSAAEDMARNLSVWAFILNAATLIPLLETVLGQVLVIELLRKVRVAPWLPVLASAAIWSAGHYRNGGLLHGLGVLPGGLVFAAAYVWIRRQGFWQSYWVTAIAHAVQNLAALTLAIAGQ